MLMPQSHAPELLVIYHERTDPSWRAKTLAVRSPSRDNDSGARRWHNSWTMIHSDWSDHGIEDSFCLRMIVSEKPVNLRIKSEGPLFGITRLVPGTELDTYPRTPATNFSILFQWVV